MQNVAYTKHLYTLEIISLMWRNMPKIVLSVSENFNKWLIDSGGSERGDRQRFIIGTLKMFQNGFIIKDGSVRKISTKDIRQNIDVLRAEADAKARKGNTTDAEGNTCVFFTPVDILDEIKNLPRFKSISEENRDTIITIGSIGSNHALTTAILGASLGLPVELCLHRLPWLQ